MSVRYVPVAGEDRCFVAYAIGKRTGSAVVRNRIRRRLRPLVGELAASGALPAGAFLISAATPAATAPSGQVREHLGRAVERATTASPR